MDTDGNIIRRLRRFSQRKFRARAFRKRICVDLRNLRKIFPLLWAEKQKAGEEFFSGFFERLAATYSRRTYRTTTIGKAAFDGRVRNGNGSDHSFKATKVLAHGPASCRSPAVSGVSRRVRHFYFKERIRNDDSGFSEQYTQKS